MATHFYDGLYVIPIHPREKRPLEADWQRRVALWPEAPMKWPGVGRWGAPQGPVNETWVLDVDVKSGGFQTLQALEAKHGPLPRTRRAQTQSGGLHVWFRWDPERPVGSWVARLPGIDTRGAGGQVLIPPTAGYIWTSEEPVAYAPPWLYEELRVGAPREAYDAGDRPPGLFVDREGAARDVRTWPVARHGEFGRAVWQLAVRLVRGRGIDADVAARMIDEHFTSRCDPAVVAEEHGGVLRACTRAADHAQVPWGFTWYHGPAQRVLLRSLRRYGPTGQLSSTVPFRVFPDGSMVQIDYKDGLASAIVDITKQTGANPPSQEEAIRAAGWWRMNGQSEGDTPTALVIDDQAGPALARLETRASGETPAWQEFLERLDAPDTFLAWLWMLTIPTATRQVLWIYGDGHDGKTVVGRVLVGALGKAGTSLDDTYLDKAERWAGRSLYGMRFVLIDDTKMRQVLRRGIIHRITGGSPIKCEPKGVDGFDFIPNVNVLATSNYLPEIGRGRADRTRLLAVKVQKGGHSEADPTWQPRLEAELPALMRRAREAYERLAVKPGVPELRLEAAVAATVGVAAEADDVMFSGILERGGLVVGEGLTCRGAELLAVTNLKPGSAEYKELVAWLRDRGCSSERTEKGNLWSGLGRPVA
jgi:hypothetical protein